MPKEAKIILSQLLSDPGRSGYDRYQNSSSCTLQRHSFFVSPSNFKEIISIVNHLKYRKSIGFDCSNRHLLNNIVSEIAPSLLLWVDLSFSDGVFHEKLKLSSVVPILKKNNSFKFENLRRISLLSVFFEGI